MLIDTHCHLDFPQFNQDRDLVLERAAAAGIGIIINPAADLDSSQRALALAAEHDNIYAGIGAHPHSVQETGADQLSVIAELAGRPKVAAIGEVGLDYYDRKDPAGSVSLPVKDSQQKLLSRFIEMANKKELPLILHCRRAADDLLAILRDELKNPENAVVHCFSEDLSALKACLDLGMYISFTANVTFPKAAPLRELVAYAPLDRIFLETDAPYLAAQEHRGKRNEPAFLPCLARAMAGIKKESYEKICGQTTDNARRFFRLQDK